MTLKTLQVKDYRSIVIFLLLVLLSNTIFAQQSGGKTSLQATSDTSALARLLQLEERLRIEKEYPQTGKTKY